MIARAPDENWRNITRIFIALSSNDKSSATAELSGWTIQRFSVN